MSLETALKRPALYNPALWSRDEVRTYYVARPKLLARFIDDFRREKPGTRPQHRLILGQRGMGKSTLLRRLAIAVDDDRELSAAWMPLVFPEEQYNVGSLADFWLNCLDALGDYLESHGRTAEMNAIDAEVERLDRKDGESALQTLLRSAEKLGRRLILLVDNIDLILDRLKEKDWALREALQEHPQLMLIGASSRALEASYDYGRAFYDFFRIDELRGLSEDEMRETIVNLARRHGTEALIRRVQEDFGRMRVLHTLTGGNPRLAVLAYGVLLKGFDSDVCADLESLLDEVTPQYKARFDELPVQAQLLLDKLALHWDPMTARQVADALGWNVNQASAQLDRLAQAGIVEKVKAGQGKRMAFQVAERFFNIWYLMRAGQRARRRLMRLVGFLHAYYSLDPAAGPDMLRCAEPAPSRAKPIRQADELMSELRRLFAAQQQEVVAGPAFLRAMVALLPSIAELHVGERVLAELDASGIGESLQPVRAALVAAVAGNAELLNDVAPEIRLPAREILARMAPSLVAD